MQNLQRKSKIVSPSVPRFGNEREFTSGTAKCSKIKRAKGRTGWPETVWVEALESGSKSNDILSSYVEEEFLDSVSMPFHSSAVPFHSENSVTGNVEILVDVVQRNQTCGESNPVFMLGNENSSYVKNNYFPYADQIIPIPESQPDSLSSKDLLSFNSGPANGCSTSPDLIHAAAFSLPFVSPTEPLPSISTLRSRHKDRCENDIYADISNPDYGVMSPDFIDYDFQNGHNEEPTFVELQPVAQFNRKCAEMA